MVIDADVGSVSARLDLDLHDAPAVGGVDTVPRRGGEVDDLPYLGLVAADLLGGDGGSALDGVFGLVAAAANPV